MTPYRDRGDELHKVYEHRMAGHPVPKETVLTPHELEGVAWAVDYTKANLNSDCPVEVEQRLVLLDDKFNIITFGTGDLLNGPRYFDLKTGDLHNYYLQMACYALMQMDRIGVDAIDVRVMFTRFQKVHELFIHRSDATKRIMAVVEAVLDPKKKPRANPYCRWCRKIMTCEAVVHLADMVKIERYEIDEPNELSSTLEHARILKLWADRVEDYAKRMALAGMEIPGFVLKSRQGAREIVDVNQAYVLSNIPADIFLSLCKISVGAIEDQVATLEKMPKSRAKNVVNERLAPVIRRRAPTVHLAATKSQEPTER